MDLAQKHCVPCEAGVPPMAAREAEERLVDIPGWELGGERKERLVHRFKFPDFRTAMEFVRKVADIAEAEDHHPDIRISYNKVDLELWTHAIGGLSENDFIVAAKVNAL